MKKRLKNLRDSFSKQSLSAVVVRNFEGDNPNVRYLSGFGGSAAVLVVSLKKAYIITDARYFARAESEAPDYKLIKVKRGARITDHVNEAFALAGLTKSSKVGFEAGRMPVQVAKEWGKQLKVKLQPTVHLVERLRQFKDQDEISQLRQACKITCKVFDEVVPLIAAGMTEQEVAFELDMRLRKHGAVSNSFTSIVASGPNSAVPHHATGQRKLKAGEPLIMDFGGLFPGGYCSDITRTVFVPGKTPHPRMVEIYNIVLAANKTARKALKSGISWRDYDKVARDYIADRGYADYFTHGLGHSMGLDVHDPFDYAHDPLTVGTVITDEPGIYIDGFGGVRIEDDLLVTENGAECLTKAPYWKF